MLPPYTLIDASGTPVCLWAQVPSVCHVNERKTRRHHPYSGSLGSHFPTYQAETLCSASLVLCDAKTAKSPSRLFQSSLFPRYLAHLLCFVLLFQACRDTEVTSRHLGCLFTRLSRFSGIFTARRQLALPGFQAIPRIHALLSDPGGILNTRQFLSRPGLLPSPSLHKVGVDVSISQLAILKTTTIQLFGAQ